MFNVAEINSMSQDLPWQAGNLVKRMRFDPKVNLQKDWKVGKTRPMQIDTKTKCTCFF